MTSFKNLRALNDNEMRLYLKAETQGTGGTWDDKKTAAQIAEELYVEYEIVLVQQDRDKMIVRTNDDGTVHILTIDKQSAQFTDGSGVN